MTWRPKTVTWDPLEEARRRIKLWRPGRDLYLVSLGLTDDHMSSLDIPDTVTDLDLTGNCLTDLSSVKFPSSMDRLSVRKNKLQLLDGTALPNLYLLDVSSNPLRSFANVRNLKTVHSFLARWCGLSSLVGLPPGVVHLDVSRNQIISMDVGTADVSTLDIVDAAWNCIPALGDLRMFTSLRCLHLRGNVGLTHCKDLLAPPTLKHISLCDD
jgi:Leucine-rich repeat (LRR) protein